MHFFLKKSRKFEWNTNHLNFLELTSDLQFNLHSPKDECGLMSAVIGIIIRFQGSWNPFNEMELISNCICVSGAVYHVMKIAFQSNEIRLILLLNDKSEAILILDISALWMLVFYGRLCLMKLWLWECRAAELWDFVSER